MKHTSAPNFAAATAWFAPLPPGVIMKSPPKMVSPTAGILGDFTTKSILELPTTTIFGLSFLILRPHTVLFKATPQHLLLN
jgi:hypothetical protein